MFENKNVLVTGGSGMIGRELVKLLKSENAIVHIADLNEPVDMEFDHFHKVNLLFYDDCITICKGMEPNIKITRCK